MREVLASGPLDFPSLYAKVTEAGPAGKFAVRSALGKGREKKEIKYAGGKYSLT